MMALMGRRLARRGITTLLPDLTGTGDSDGEFQEAQYGSWRSDIETCQKWIVAQDGVLRAVIGVRFGALLAMDLVTRLQNPPVTVLWNPLIDGDGLIRQFLRLRIASRLGSTGPERETVATLLDTLAAGTSIEVAGYTLSAELVRSLRDVSLSQFLPVAGQRIFYLQIAAATAGGLGPAAARAVEALSATGAQVTAEVVPGDAFWSSTEISICEPLLESTERSIAETYAG
jgi:exosortase A-associated hydrolase 2